MKNIPMTDSLGSIGRTVILATVDRGRDISVTLQEPLWSVGIFE